MKAKRKISDFDTIEDIKDRLKLRTSRDEKELSDDYLQRLGFIRLFKKI